MTQKTVLFNAHKDLGADMTDFGGFEMPIRYKNSSIIDEHLAVRNKVGMFDVSHMGRYWVSGKDAKRYLDLLVPRNIMNLSPGRAGYTFMLNENGGFRDDVIISQLDDREFMVVCNAGNREKIWNWMSSFELVWKSAGKDVSLVDKSEISCMIAVQGPESPRILENLLEEEIPGKRFRVKWGKINGETVLVSTTGYTGEAGVELIVIAENETIETKSIDLWNLLLSKNVVPCALGSRDTLRLETGYCLYGNDIDEKTHLLESSLDFIPFAVIDKEGGYIGQKAVLKKRNSVTHVRIGFKLLSKGIARNGYRLLIDNEEVGYVTSGTQSPLTKLPIGMAYIKVKFKQPGTKILVDIRGKLKEAEVITFPTYNTRKFGGTRQA